MGVRRGKDVVKMGATGHYIGTPNGIVLCVCRNDRGTIEGELYHAYCKEGIPYRGYEQIIKIAEELFNALGFPHMGTGDRDIQGYTHTYQKKEGMTRVMADDELLEKHGDMGTFVIREIYLKPFEISVKEGGANAVMVSWSFIGNKWTGECSGLLNTVLRDEWGFRGMALTDFFRNNGHGFMNADAALANGVDAMLSTFDGEENNVANRNHPTSVLQMRNACKNVMYTVVSSWSYDGNNVNVGMENWKKIGIGIDVILILILIALEVVVIKGYKKRTERKVTVVSE